MTAFRAHQRATLAPIRKTHAGAVLIVEGDARDATRPPSIRVTLDWPHGDPRPWLLQANHIEITPTGEAKYGR
jgi:hypothetical protein